MWRRSCQTREWYVNILAFLFFKEEKLLYILWKWFVWHFWVVGKGNIFTRDLNEKGGSELGQAGCSTKKGKHGRGCRLATKKERNRALLPASWVDKWKGEKWDKVGGDVTLWNRDCFLLTYLYRAQSNGALSFGCCSNNDDDNSNAIMTS